MFIAYFGGLLALWLLLPYKLPRGESLELLIMVSALIWGLDGGFKMADYVQTAFCQNPFLSSVFSIIIE